MSVIKKHNLLLQILYSFYISCLRYDLHLGRKTKNLIYLTPSSPSYPRFIYLLISSQIGPLKSISTAINLLQAIVISCQKICNCLLRSLSAPRCPLPIHSPLSSQTNLIRPCLKSSVACQQP